jgi:hypothetical protein
VTDKALLDLAAKAAGIKIWWGRSFSDYEDIKKQYRAIPDEIMYSAPEWAPLENDGDSRRLELACLNWLHNNYPTGSTYPAEIAWAINEYSLWRWRNDPTEYRRAVVELAAEIGKVMSAGKGGELDEPISNVLG